VSDQHLVIVNPNAARLRDAATRRSLLADLRTVLERRDGTAPLVIETQSPSEVRPAVERGVADGISGVVGVGGDGTLRDIAGVLAGGNVPLGVVPAGTGNQLAAVMGIPLSPQRAISALDRAQPRRIDLGEVTLHLTDAPAVTTAFTIGCGAGFDARLMATTPKSWKRRVGKAAYFAQALRLATKIGMQPYQISIDDQVIEVEASIALLGNMGQLVPGLLGLRLPIVPDDGLLDLIVVGARNPIHGMRGLADQMWRTSLGGSSGSHSLRLRGRKISVQPSRPEPLEVDGDYVGDGSLEARVVPGAIGLLVPAD
jgi:diacylglycerol kinase (ATP)